MNPKQMYRMMRQHGISLVFEREEKVWYAGDCIGEDENTSLYLVNTLHGRSVHVGKTPEEAVEDYCNARDLEWDR